MARDWGGQTADPEVVPATADPHHGNNPRANRSKKHKPLNIRNNPKERRTLRKTVRKAWRKKTDANYIRPWVRENPAFRFQHEAYPAASLLGLPKELRQKILYMQYPLPKDDGQASSYFGSRRGNRWRALCTRIGELCTVSPVLRVDMQYVGAQWKEELRMEEEARKEQLRESGKSDFHTMNEGFFSKKQTAKERVIEVKRGKKHSKRTRPPKCWYCEERHPQGDPICPMERKNMWKWLKNTKVLKGRSRPLKEGKDAKKRHIVFQ